MDMESLFRRKWMKPLVEIRFSRGIVETRKIVLRDPGKWPGLKCRERKPNL